MKFISSHHRCRRDIHNCLRFESLEERLALATHIWTGAVSSLWSNSGNWAGGSPAGDSQAVLSFPSAVNLSNNNDLVGLKVAAIDFAARNYVLSGNPITLVLGPSGIPRIHMDAGVGPATIRIDLRRSPANIGLTVDVADSSVLTLAGVISGGTSATNLVKEGPGTLALVRPNTFADRVLVNGGRLNTNNQFALGTLDADTTVANGSTLSLASSIAEPLVLSSSTLHSVSGNNISLGSVTLVNSNNFEVSAGSLNLSGVIGGSGGFTLSSDAPARLFLSGANTFTGPVTVSGILNLRDPLALGQAAGANVTVSNGGSLELDLQGTNSFTRSLIVARAGGNGALRNISGDNTWAGPVLLTFDDATIDVVGGKLNLSGAIRHSLFFSRVGITKAGGGPLFLSGTSTYLGGTTIKSGTLFVNGSLSSDVVLDGGRLGGTGTVSSIRGIGYVEPGVSTGRLTTNGSTSDILGREVGVQFGAATYFEVDLNGTTAGTSYDQLRVSVRPSLGLAALNVHLNFFPSVGTSFRIIDNTSTGLFTSSIIGTFANLPEGAIIPTSFGNLRISYVGGDGNDVVVTTVTSLIITNTPSRFPDRSVTPVIDEGDVATVTGTISDPDLHDVFFLDVNWGDGTPTEKHVFPPGSNGQQVQLTHRYIDDEPTNTPQDDYNIQLAWHDKAGEGSSATLTTTVRNVAPVVNAVPEVQLSPSGLLHQLVTFTDPGRDKWTATVDFGDGGGPQSVDVLGGKQLLLHHRYQQRGTYMVKVVVTDDDGGGVTTSFRVRLADRLEPSLVDSFFEWLDDYEQENKPRRPGLR